MANSAVTHTVDIVVGRVSKTGILPMPEHDGDEEDWINYSKWPEPPGVTANLVRGDAVRIGLDKTGFIRWTIRRNAADPWDEPPPAEAPPKSQTTSPPAASCAGDQANVADMIRCSAVKAAGELVGELVRSGAVRSVDDAAEALARLATLARQLMTA